MTRINLDVFSAVARTLAGTAGRAAGGAKGVFGGLMGQKLGVDSDAGQSQSGDGGGNGTMFQPPASSKPQGETAEAPSPSVSAAPAQTRVRTPDADLAAAAADMAEQFELAILQSALAQKWTPEPETVVAEAENSAIPAEASRPEAVQLLLPLNSESLGGDVRTDWFGVAFPERFGRSEGLIAGAGVTTDSVASTLVVSATPGFGMIPGNPVSDSASALASNTPPPQPMTEAAPVAGPAGAQPAPEVRVAMADQPDQVLQGFQDVLDRKMAGSSGEVGSEPIIPAASDAEPQMRVPPTGQAGGPMGDSQPIQGREAPSPATDAPVMVGTPSAAQPDPARGAIAGMTREGVVAPDVGSFSGAEGLESDSSARQAAMSAFSKTEIITLHVDLAKTGSERASVLQEAGKSAMPAPGASVPVAETAASASTLTGVDRAVSDQPSRVPEQSKGEIMDFQAAQSDAGSLSARAASGQPVKLDSQPAGNEAQSDAGSLSARPASGQPVKLDSQPAGNMAEPAASAEIRPVQPFANQAGASGSAPAAGHDSSQPGWMNMPGAREVHAEVSAGSSQTVRAAVDADAAVSRQAAEGADSRSPEMLTETILAARPAAAQPGELARSTGAEAVAPAVAGNLSRSMPRGIRSQAAERSAVSNQPMEFPAKAASVPAAAPKTIISERASVQVQEMLARRESGEPGKAGGAGLEGVAGLKPESAQPGSGMPTVALDAAIRQGAATRTTERVERLQELAARLDEHVLDLTCGKGNTMVVQLTPPNLGRVSLSCREEAGNIRLEIAVENDSVRTMLQQQERHLREMLEQGGYRLAQFEVKSEGQGLRQGGQRKPNTAPRRQRIETLDEAVPEPAAAVAPGLLGRESVWYIA